MAQKKLTLKPKQARFQKSKARYVGFVGGIGSGKTFTGLARGIEWSMQPRPKGSYYGPRGACLAIHHRELDDVVLPEFFEMMDGSGLFDPGKDYQKSKRIARVRDPNGGPDAQILFRSLNNPNWMRGLQLSWFFIDEARNVPGNAWNILVGRLRQPGYDHGGWLATTPDGLNWVYDRFHKEGEIRRRLANPNIYELIVSSTEENREHLPEGYIEDLYANYTDENGELTPFGRQEILGEFVGLTEGAVFYGWKQKYGDELIEYDAAQTLYSTWDFGVGDPGVLEFAHVDYIAYEKDEHTIYLPRVKFLDAIEQADVGAKWWAKTYDDWLETHTKGKRPLRNYGDPAGRSRSPGSGTSVIEDLAAEGIVITPAPKLPADHGIRLLNNMMQGGRIRTDRDRASRLGQAFATARWKLDDNGRKTGTSPVHDWTSHYITAAYYLANSLFRLRPRRDKKPTEPPPPGSAADIKRQLLGGPTKNRFGHRVKHRIQWTPGPVGQ